VELIEGEVFDMSPSPSVIHQRLSRRLQYQIESFLRQAGGPCELFHAPLDVLLPKDNNARDDEIDTVVQPDLFVVCDAAKTRGRACRGAPDWIIEFLSPNNALHDLNRKYDLYERAGVREYWVVDPANSVVFVYRLGRDGGYAREGAYGAYDEPASVVVEGLRVDLSEVFGVGESDTERAGLDQRVKPPSNEGRGRQ
jgi:Uma2 family endonuclease